MAILLWIEESAKYHYKKIKVTISETSKSFRPFLHSKKTFIESKGVSRAKPEGKKDINLSELPFQSMNILNQKTKAENFQMYHTLNLSVTIKKHPFTYFL